MAKQICPVEIRQLVYFVAAAEHGSLRKAGTALDLSESSISRSLRALENHLGVSLFHRRTTGVTLTYAGERFLRKVRHGLRIINEGKQNLAVIGRGEEGILRLGVFSTLSSGFLKELLRAYVKQHRKVKLDFIDGDPAEHVAAVRQLRLDVAFITGTKS